MWNENEPVHECSECRYPYQGTYCPNPGCDVNTSPAVRAERAERKRQDDEFWANWRRFYHGGRA